MSDSTPYSAPDELGFYGKFGGRFVAETLMHALKELTDVYQACKADPQFRDRLHSDLEHYVGRPTPLYFAQSLTESIGGGRIFLKREDLNHTGAHKINNTVGQALLAEWMGKKRIIAETGAGQHGVATATVCARMNCECVIYMGESDVQRQALNVYRMRLLGAEVRTVSTGSRTLKDAMNEAMRDWVTNIDTTHYIIGSVAGPHPYPLLVRDFQSVIGREAKQQCLEQTGSLPDVLIACVGGGSNAMGLFYPFVDDEVEFIGVEAGGLGIETGKHAATLNSGSPGVLHGSHSFLLQDSDGQVVETESISAGLDYPGVGPEHSHWKETGRAKYVSVSNEQALKAFHRLNKSEGILPALESSHALAYAIEEAARRDVTDVIVVNLSGRGDKDIDIVAQEDGIAL